MTNLLKGCCSLAVQSPLVVGQNNQNPLTLNRECFLSTVPNDTAVSVVTKCEVRADEITQYELDDTGSDWSAQPFYWVQLNYTGRFPFQPRIPKLASLAPLLEQPIRAEPF